VKESNIRSKIVDELRRQGLFAFAVETGLVTAGVPDVCTTGEKTCWYEIKYVRSFPAREDTVIYKGLMRPVQINWWKEYAAAEGSNYNLIVRVFETYYLFPGWATQTINTWNAKDYNTNCHYRCQSRSVDWLRLLNLKGED
jgi:hypothetical protein